MCLGKSDIEVTIRPQLNVLNNTGEKGRLKCTEARLPAGRSGVSDPGSAGDAKDHSAVREGFGQHRCGDGIDEYREDGVRHGQV